MLRKSKVKCSKPRQLTQKFFSRQAEIVAKALLGKVISVKAKGKTLKARIAETEAYYGRGDPASRAYGKKTALNAPMWEAPGTVFVYMVHANWLFNIVTGKAGDPQAVLIRAAEPLNFKADCFGPGKLTRALGITKAHNMTNVCDPNSQIQILDAGFKPAAIARSHRIGVKRDLRKKLRFYVKLRLRRYF